MAKSGMQIYRLPNCSHPLQSALRHELAAGRDERTVVVSDQKAGSRQKFLKSSKLIYKQVSVKYNFHTKESMLPAKLFFKGVEALKLPPFKLLQLKLRWD